MTWGNAKFASVSLPIRGFQALGNLEMVVPFWLKWLIVTS